MDRYYRFTLLLHGLIKNIRKIEEKEALKYSLKREHVTIIHCLYSNGALRSKDLSDFLLLDKGQLSRCLTFLEKEGYVMGLTGSSKKYNAKISLTEKGVLIGKSLDEKIKEVLNDSSKGLEEKEREKMYEYLEVVFSNLIKITEEK